MKRSAVDTSAAAVGSHYRASSVDRTRYISRQRPRPKPEIDSALAIYEAKLHELMAASEVLQQQIDKWQNGLAVRSNTTIDPGVSGVEGVAQQHSTDTASGPKRTDPKSDPASPSKNETYHIDAAARRYHIAEASKIMSTNADSGDSDSSGDEEEIHSRQVLRGSKEVTKKTMIRTATADGENVRPSQAMNRPAVPKLGLSSAVGHGAWLGGECTQGDTYKNTHSPSSSSESG